MTNLQEIISKNLRKMLLNEVRQLPSDANIAACPSIYKAIRPEHLNSYLEHGFNHQLAGDGGTMRGEGVYSSLELSGGIYRTGGYGSVLLKGKVLGGFKNYIMFDSNRYPSIKRQIIKNYGSDLSPDDQIRSIVKDPRDASELIRAGVHMNNYQSTVKICRKWGIRGIMYDDYVATVLPFDFSSIILWEVAQGVSRWDNETTVKPKFKKVFDLQARERYENRCDWEYLTGFFDYYDKENAIKLSINNEIYCIVGKYGNGYRNYEYNFAKVDTDNIINPKPEVISDVWFNDRPTTPSVQDGVFQFKYNGITLWGALDLPGDKVAGIWFPEEIERIYDYPDINDPDGWVELNINNLNVIARELRSYRNVSESIKSSFRKALNEEIRDKTEAEFIAKHRAYIYRGTPSSTLDSIFKHGQLREFASSYDGSWYGDGIYAVLDPSKVQMRKYGGRNPGDVPAMIQMIVMGGFGRFLIFDDLWAKRVYGPKHQIEDQIRVLFPADVAQKIIAEITDWQKRKLENCQDTMFPNPRTTGMLHVMFDARYGNKNKYENLFSQYNVKGAIYNGGNDGLAIVCWNFDEVIPFKYSYDGKNFLSDKFDFEWAKERSQRNSDPISKFRHLYRKIDMNVHFCKVGDKKISVTPVQTKEGGYNIIDTSNGNKISQFDFDETPSISSDGIFTFKYRGRFLYGTVLLPSAGIPAFWFPEDESRMTDYPDITDEDSWCGFNDLPNIG